MIKKIGLLSVILTFNFNLLATNNFNNLKNTKIALPSQLDLRENFVLKLDNVEDTENILCLMEAHLAVKYSNSKKVGFIGYIVLSGKRYTVYKNQYGKVSLKYEVNEELTEIFSQSDLQIFFDKGISQESLLIFCKIFEVKKMKTTDVDWNYGSDIIKDLGLDVINTQSRYEKIRFLKDIIGKNFLKEHLKEITKFVINYPEGIDYGLNFLIQYVSKLRTAPLPFDSNLMITQLSEFICSDLWPTTQEKWEQIIYTAGIIEYRRDEKNLRKIDLIFNKSKLDLAAKKLTESFLEQYPQYNSNYFYIELSIHSVLIELFNPTVSYGIGKKWKFRPFVVDMCNPLMTIPDKVKYCEKFQNEKRKEFFEISEIVYSKTEGTFIDIKISTKPDIDTDELIDWLQKYMLKKLDNSSFKMTFFCEISKKNFKQTCDELVLDFIQQNEIDKNNEKLKKNIEEVMMRFFQKIYDNKNIFSELMKIKSEEGKFENAIIQIFDEFRAKKVKYVELLFQDKAQKKFLDTLNLATDKDQIWILCNLYSLRIFKSNELLKKIAVFLLQINRAKMGNLAGINLRLYSMTVKAV